MNNSLEQMIIDAVSERGVAHQISAALIAGDAHQVGLIVRRAVEAVRKQYAEDEESEREYQAEKEGRRRDDTMDMLSGLTIWAKP